MNIKNFEQFNESLSDREGESGELIDGELIDTYGGDYTYRDVTYEIINGEIVFFEKHYGANPIEEFQVDDPSDIEEYKSYFK